MIYLVTFFNKIKNCDLEGVIISSITSFYSLGGDEESDKLRIIIRTQDINSDFLGKLKKVKFIQIVSYEDLESEFEIFYSKKLNNKIDDKERINQFLGIYISSWYGNYKMDDGYFLIENDIFVNSHSIIKLDKIINEKSNRIQLIQGEIVDGNIISNCTIMYVPNEMKEKYLQINTDILIKNNLNTMMLWEKLKEYLDPELFELNNKVCYWYKSKSENFSLIHRNGTILQKEFTSINQNSNEWLFNRMIEKDFIEDNEQFENIILKSQSYRKQLKYVSEKFGLKLPMSDEEYYGILSKLKGNWISFNNAMFLKMNEINEDLNDFKTLEIDSKVKSVNYKNKKIITFGTFDLFHIGHKKIIDHALEIAVDPKNLYIGVSSDKWNLLKGKKSVQNENERMRIVKTKYPGANVILEDHEEPEQTWPNIFEKYKLDLIVMGADHSQKLSYLNDVLTPNGTKMKITFFERTPNISSTFLKKIYGFQ